MLHSLLAVILLASAVDSPSSPTPEVAPEAAQLPPVPARPTQSDDEAPRPRKVRKKVHHEPDAFSPGIAAVGALAAGGAVVVLGATSGVVLGGLAASLGALGGVPLAVVTVMMLGAPAVLIAVGLASIVGGVAGALLEWRLGNRGILLVAARAFLAPLAALAVGLAGAILVVMAAIAAATTVGILAQSDYRWATLPTPVVLGVSSAAAAIGFGAAALLAAGAAAGAYAGVSAFQGAITPGPTRE